MATFTGTGSHNSNYTGTLTVTESSYSVANNTSEVAYSLVLTGNNGYYFQQWYLTTKVTINGTEVQNRYEKISMPSPSGGVSTYAVCNGTLTVPHNNDGTKTISVSATMSTVTSQSILPGTINMSGDLALTTIPRASTMTVPSFTIGSAGTMTISMASSSFSHTITYSFSGLTGTAASVNAGVSSASWTPPNTFYAKLPNSTSGTVSLVLNTYSGSTLVGSKSYTATVAVGSSIKPTAPSITLSPVNTNAWISSKGLYVAGYTKIRVQSSATAGSGASMSSYTISGAFSGTGSEVTSSVISSSGTKSVKVTATDSRGRTNSASSSVSFLAYSNPSLTTFKAVRGTYSGGTWTSSVNGDHIRVQAVGTVSLSANGNTGTKTVKIGSTNPSATSGNYYYFTGTNATTSYTVTGTITDSLGNSSTRTLTVSTIEVPFNVDVDLPGVGVGMIAQNARQMDISNTWKLSPFSVVGSQYYTSGFFGINLNNSDIIGANGIFFADTANSRAEGLMFIRSNNNYDVLYALDGNVYVRKDQDIGGTAVAGTQLLTTDDVKDYVISKYTESSWTVLQWNSGTAECWGTFTVAVPANGWNAWGSVYEAQPTTALKPAYPSGLFTATPEIQVSIHNASVGCMGCELYGTHSKTEAPRIIPLRPSSYSSAATFNVYIHAIGKWK